MSAVVIDPEFRDAIPPLSPDEFETLQESILAEGCREALVLWRGLLLDGHHRHRICEQHGIAYETTTIDLPDRDAALDWIDLNQLGRRNLTDDQRRYYMGRRYNRVKKQGARTDLTSAQNEQKLTTAESIAADEGVGQATVRRAAKFAEQVDADPDLREAVVVKRQSATKVKREQKEQRREARREQNRAIVEAAPEPESAIVAGARFATIVMDPPWDFRDEGDHDVYGRTRPTYAQMSEAQVAALPVAELADEDCHLYLWITNRSLLTGKGWRLCEAWGFRPITVITWCKPSIGVGNYFRNNTEHLVFAVRGQQPLKRADVGTWFEAPRGPLGHSSKPLHAYALIESCSPGPYLDMFARTPRDGWVLWGAEADAA
jgi:N6-adenosine-specific RNA methylase IME4